MAESTSVGSVQLDVKLNQRSLQVEMNKLGRALNSSFKGMFDGFVGQTANFIKNSITKMGSGFKSLSQASSASSEKVAKSVTRMNNEYEKTQQKINEIRNELAKLFTEQDAIINRYRDMPAITGMSKDETLESFLKANPRFQELSAQIDKLMAKLDPLVAKSKELDKAMGKAGNEVEKTSNKINILGNSAKKTAKGILGLTWFKKAFNNEAKKAARNTSNFGRTLNRVTRIIARNLIVYGLIIRGIRELISYTWSALKTNEQFLHSLNIIKTNLMVAFQPIYDFILPALNALMQAIARVTTYIASAISALFGKTYQQSFNAAKNLNNARKAMAGYGSAAKKAGKEAQGALMSFDEIHQLDIKEDVGTAGAGGVEGFEMVMPDTSTIDLSGLEKFKTLLQPTIDSLKRLDSVLEPLKNFAAQGLQDFYNNFLVPLGKWTFGEGLPRFIDAITKGLGQINWDRLNNSLKDLWKNLAVFSINVGEGLLWFWENVLVPLGTWTMNEVVPRFLNILAEAIRVLNSVIEVLKPLAIWLWENFLLPLARWTGGAIIDILDGIAHAFSKIADYIDGIKDIIAKSDSFLDALVDVGVYLVEGLFKGIISALAGIGSWLWDNLVRPIINGVKNLFGIQSPSTVFIEIGEQLIEGLFVGISNTWNKIVDFFAEKLDVLKNLFTETWESIKETATEIWNNLKESATEIWTSISEFISNTWDIIREKTSETWNSIKSFLIDTIWTPIKSMAKTIWEGIKKNILEPMRQAWTSLKQIWDNLKKYILDKWNEIRIGISSMKNNLVNAIKEPFNIAKNFIDGVIKDARNWGRNLISNFTDGIRSMINNVKSAAKNVANTVKDFLGFSSPTKMGPGRDADKWMPNLIEMVAEGLTQNIPKVKAAVDEVAKQLTGIISQPILHQPIMEYNTTTIADSAGLSDSVAQAVYRAMMDAIRISQATSTQHSEDRELVLKLDNTVLARMQLPALTREAQRQGFDLIIRPQGV